MKSNNGRQAHLLSPVVWTVVAACCWWESWSMRKWDCLAGKKKKIYVSKNHIARLDLNHF